LRYVFLDHFFFISLQAILENIACEILGFLDTYAQRFLGKVVTAESSEILKEIGRIRNLRRSKIV